MEDHDSDFTPQQKRSLQRIATLQRMREEARESKRAAMLDSLEKLLEIETRLLREARDTASSRD